MANLMFRPRAIPQGLWKYFSEISMASSNLLAFFLDKDAFDSAIKVASFFRHFAALFHVDHA